MAGLIFCEMELSKDCLFHKNPKKLMNDQGVTLPHGLLWVRLIMQVTVMCCCFCMPQICGLVHVCACALSKPLKTRLEIIASAVNRLVMFTVLL